MKPARPSLNTTPKANCFRPRYDAVYIGLTFEDRAEPARSD